MSVESNSKNERSFPFKLLVYFYFNINNYILNKIIFDLK